MKSFKTDRFLQYARYDLTLNKVFYRNIAIVTAAISVGLAVLGFLGRWIAIPNEYDEFKDLITDDSYFTVTWTTFFITTFLGLMALVYAGCIHHPLRTKQARISVLTLPATNAEKFTWHTLLVIVGGTLLGYASLVLADGVNALLSLLAGIPVDKIYSITAEHVRYLSFSTDLPMFNNFGVNQANPFSGELYLYLILLSISSGIWMVSAYAFGNAVKYRYNIVWTILALQALQFIVSVLTIILAVSFGESIFGNMDETDVENFVRGFLISCIAFCVLTSVLMWWGNWRLYKKAQITSKLNR